MPKMATPKDKVPKAINKYFILKIFGNPEPFQPQVRKDKKIYYSPKNISGSFRSPLFFMNFFETNQNFKPPKRPITRNDRA